MRTRNKILAAVLAAIVAVVIGAPWLIPLSRFIPLLEARAQERLRQPVHIARLQAYLFPLPSLVASGIVVGEGMVRIQRLRVKPSLWHLFDQIKRIDEVQADGVVITREALQLAPGWIKPQAQGAPKAELRSLSVRNAQLQFGSLVLKELAAEASLEAGTLRRFRLGPQDDHLRIVGVPDGPGQYRLTIVAHDWQVPAGPPVMFKRLAAIALLTDRAIDAREIHATLYGGSVSGRGSVAWNPAWTVAGTLNVEQVNLRPLLALFTRQSGLSGLLSARPSFAAQAHDPSALLPALALRSQFTVQQGVLQRVDLHAAAQNPLSSAASKSGSTQFDELSGEIEIDPSGYHFDDLKVSSGLFSAAGTVSIARDQTLSGYLEAAVAGTGQLLAVPLKVSGTLKEPSIAPTRTAVAATVAGSVLLPGLGTAVGLKAGQLTERLFGSHRRAASPTTRAPAPLGREATAVGR